MVLRPMVCPDGEVEFRRDRRRVRGTAEGEVASMTTGLLFEREAQTLSSPAHRSKKRDEATALNLSMVFGTAIRNTLR